MGLDFCCLTLLQPEKCLLAYIQCILYDQCHPLFHSSLLTAKTVDLVVAHDGFFCTTEIICIFHSGYRGAFFIHTAV